MDSAKNIVPYRLSIILLFCACLGSCSKEADKPPQDSEAYQQVVSDFYISMAAIESDEALFAAEKMQQVADTYPDEPAAWANLSVFAMRQGNFDLATERINKALDLASGNSRIIFLSSILESRKGNIEAALKKLKQAHNLDPGNLKIKYALVEALERQNPNENNAEMRKILDEMVREDPDNLAIRLESIRVYNSHNDLEALKQALEKIQEQLKGWPEDIQRQFQVLTEAVESNDKNSITYELALFKNVLNPLPQYQHDLQEIQFPSNQIGFLIHNFLWLPKAQNNAAVADTSIQFSFKQDTLNQEAAFFKPVQLSDTQAITIAQISDSRAIIGSGASLPFPGSADHGSPNSITTIDYNYDFRNDLAFAGTNGFKLYRQAVDSTFTDVTDSLNLSGTILSGSYHGVWANDIDLDGDLDLVLAPQQNSPIILRNNGDGAFSTRSYFNKTDSVHDFLWGDYDQDGDSDAIFLTTDGTLDYYNNKRAGSFEFQPLFSDLKNISAADFSDLNADGTFEIITLHPDKIAATHFVDSTAEWSTKSLVSFDDRAIMNNSNPQLFIADLDNNAALDLVVSDSASTRFWLNDETYTLIPTPFEVPVYTHGIADINGDTRLDLIGLTKNNHQFIGVNSGDKSYHGRILRLRASSRVGDRRINSFGIGGEIEARSGVQYIKQPIKQPSVHIGLGNYEEAKMLRIIWPNGTTQAEFAELGYETNIMNEQILKGSCPWLLTYNGEQMEFVTDLLWRTALGLRINAQGKAAVIHSVDWVKIDGQQLRPKNDYYDIRITADLWETHFFDHVSLMAVDSPENTEVFVDERFTLPPPEQELYVMKDIQSVASAFDYTGRDVSQKVASQDKKYVNSLPLTSYQGFTEEHYIEIEIGERFEEKAAQWLLASGWIYPTDSSINVAISQGNHNPPHGIRVEVPNGQGGWKVARQNVGFPAGKNKTMLIEISDLFEPGTEKRLRLYTNMEIYWDQFRVGTRVANPQIKTKKLDAESAQLQYRGFSELVSKDRFQPTVPNYQQVSGTAPRWRDLVGFYTRFGEVKELTRQTDDRFVIMNAGDELALRFSALEQPRKGWKRDFVFIGDGWVKDGDYNTGFSKTVLPLPYHGMQDYSQEPGRLQDDPVYQQHRKDWVDYHTRYITPQYLSKSLLINHQ